MIDAQSGRDVWGAPPAPDPVHLREPARGGTITMCRRRRGRRQSSWHESSRHESSRRLDQAAHPSGDRCPSEALCSCARLIPLPLRNSGESPAQDPHRPRTIR